MALPPSSGLAEAELHTRELSYQSAEGATLRGYLAYDAAQQGPRPGILVAPEFWGLNDYIRRRARELAALGYTALALDMYGDGKVTRVPAEAVALMQAATASPELTRQRFEAALDLLLRQPEVDPQRVGAIGYCFGGKLVLDMARQGLPLAGVVSFHGRLTPTVPATPGAVRARVLVEHGEADSMTTPEQLRAFEEEMRQAGVDYRLVVHPGARHGFTNPQADERRTEGLDIGYQKEADERSWEDMKAFFAEVFRAQA